MMVKTNQLLKSYYIQCRHCGTILIMPEATKQTAVWTAEHNGWYKVGTHEWAHDDCHIYVSKLSEGAIKVVVED